MVCDGDDSALFLVSGASVKRTARIPLINGSASGAGDSLDAVHDDDASRLYYIGNGGASAKQPKLKNFGLFLRPSKLIGDFGVPGTNVEATCVDRGHGRLSINIRDKKQVGVYNLATRKLLTNWTATGINCNTSLLLDFEHERIFVAGCTPGMLYVFDRDGKVVAQLPGTEQKDDMKTRRQKQPNFPCTDSDHDKDDLCSFGMSHP